jgi:flavin reductase (DIM6/NTAB) family NADH-FMN oxidoreductase RutF
MEKQKMGAFNYIYPLPAILLGANVNGKPNFTTLGNCGIVSMSPCTVYVSSQKNHYTNIGIKATGVFSINIPSIQLVEKTDYCGLVSGYQTDKSSIFTTFYGEIGVPMIEECPVNLECKVIKVIEINNMEMFIGEVIQSYIDQGCIENGNPNAMKIDPLIYDIGNTYRNLGNWTAQAFKTGMNILNTIKK